MKWWDWIRLKMHPSTSGMMELQGRIATFQQDLQSRIDDINKMRENLDAHLRFFQEVQERNATSIDKILYAFEVDVPCIEDQGPFEAGIFDLPYFINNSLLFNPTCTEIRGTRYLVIRFATFNPHKPPPYDTFSKIAYVPLSDTHIAGDIRFVELPLGPSKKEQWEDPRILNIGHRLWLTCTNFIQGKTYAHQTMAVLDTNWKLLGVNHPEYGNNGSDIRSNSGHEKNWTWFFHEGSPHMIYLLDPHTVVKCDSVCNPIETYETADINKLWTYGTPRGGSNPILVDGEYWGFFHGSTPWWQGRRRYYMGAYAFESQPPFRITRMTSMPLLTGSKNNKRVLEFPLVVFPGGALFDEAKREWFVVFGSNDCQSGWVKIPHEDLLQVTRTLNKKVKYGIPFISKTEAESDSGANRLGDIRGVETQLGDDLKDSGPIPDTGNAGYPYDPETGKPNEQQSVPPDKFRSATTFQPGGSGARLPDLPSETPESSGACNTQ